MASSTGQENSILQNIMLTPQQRAALLQALGSQQASTSLGQPTSSHMSLSPSSFNDSPQQKADYGNFQESPFLDNYDYSFADSSIDFDVSYDPSTTAMIGDLPDVARSESTENEGHEKRAHPDDEEDEATGKSGAKRRESTEKVPKKPGRKPLTSEPTSKRKAQNRAAQRAFRERKEKHLKDLETKVEELEQKSEAATSENTQLRAKLQAVTAELNEYKQKLQLVGKSKPLSQGSASRGFGHAAINNLGDVNFQFEFPKFGSLPGPPATATTTSNKPTRQSSSSSTPQAGSNAASPNQQQANGIRKDAGASPSSLSSLSKNDLGSFSSAFGSHQPGTTAQNGSRVSLDSNHFNLGVGTTSSPSASSISNVGASSSCGTSPEPFNQSPMGFKPLDTMTTIGEEHSSLTANNMQAFNHFAGVDVSSSGFDWLAQQNGGQFDPQLFGDYREPQEQVLSNPNFEDLFNDSLEADFFTPYNLPAIGPMPKKNLIAEIDDKQNEDDKPVKNEKLNCTDVWNKLQNCPKVQSGDLDLDGLCSELQKKAKCGGTGPVVQDQDFHDILKKYLGKDLSEACKDSNPAKPMYP